MVLSKWSLLNGTGGAYPLAVEGAQAEGPTGLTFNTSGTPTKGSVRSTVNSTAMPFEVFAREQLTTMAVAWTRTAVETGTPVEVSAKLVVNQNTLCADALPRDVVIDTPDVCDHVATSRATVNLLGRRAGTCTVKVSLKGAAGEAKGSSPIERLTTRVDERAPSRTQSHRARRDVTRTRVVAWGSTTLLASMSKVRRLSNITELTDAYDGFLVDLWGVVHDGERLYDGVLETLDAIARRGARVVFLSNSSRLGSQLAASLVAMGLQRETFVEVVSSGDVTREVLVRREEPFFERFGIGSPTRALHLGTASYVPWLFEMDLELVDDGAAKLVIATGSVASESELDAIRARLAPLAARDVPLVCTNPDRILVTKKGLGIAPGAVAHAYAELGGATFLYGKPHPPIYRRALARLAASGVAEARTVAVGDMIETDIVGARGANLPSVLVTSGVHAAELGAARDDAGALARLFERHGAAPDAVIATFGQSLAFPLGT